jgi:hypothetical protein
MLFSQKLSAHQLATSFYSQTFYPEPKSESAEMNTNSSAPIAAPGLLILYQIGVSTNLGKVGKVNLSRTNHT